MRVCLVSWTRESRECIKRFSSDINVLFVAEKDFSFWGIQSKKSGYAITSIDAAVIAYRKKKIEKFVIPCLLKGNVLSTMYVTLKSYNIPDEDILYVSYNCIKGNEIIKSKEMCVFVDRKELDRLELHINDHCNLRCAGCSMLAGLVKKEENANLELTKQSLLKLQSIFSHIMEIDIFGGEPLLNPDLPIYCDFLRTLFPDSVIFIVTNGIELCSLNQNTLKSIQKNNIRLSITYYPVFDSYIEQAIKLCQKMDISFNILQKRVNFLNLYDFSGLQNSDEVFKLCKRRLSIIAMRENKLASCYTPFSFCYAEKEFQIGYNENEIIDILYDDLSPREIVARFMQPMDCCRFCHCDKTEWYQINSLDTKISDWSR